MNGKVALVIAAVLLALWVVLGLVIPIGSGWIHLALAAGVLMVIRGVVTLVPRGTTP